MATSIKVMTILGTRPEIIRLSRVMAALDEHTDHVIVHTGQNYDFELNEIFFKELDIRKPDHYLNVDASSLGSMLGGILEKIEPVLQSEKPDAVLILGDTNSSIAGIMAKRLKIPVYHMEAGNRCFDLNVPEELNRKIIDHISDFNLVYTEHARRHLLSEGKPHRRIYLTGSPMNEVLKHYSASISASNILATEKLEEQKYFLVSIHREENVDSEENLRSLLQALADIAAQFEFPVITSTHPRTRKRIEALDNYTPHPLIRFCKPFGFMDYNRLQKSAYCVLSDSGTISEESAMLGFPAITVRTAMERPEALDTGSIVISGLDSDSILNCLNLVTTQFSQGRMPQAPQEYCVDDVSLRVTRLIVGTCKLSNMWDGVKGPNWD